MPPSTRDQILMNLALAKAPTADSAAALADQLDGPQSSTAALALGAQAGTLGDDASGDAIDTLLERYADATTIADKILYLDALANTGSRRALPVMQDAIQQGESYPLACAGAFGLRRIPGDDVDDLLQALIQGGTVVIVQAIKATAYRSPPSGSRASPPTSRPSTASSASSTRSRPCSSRGPSWQEAEHVSQASLGGSRWPGGVDGRRSAATWLAGMAAEGTSAAGTATESRWIASAAVEAQHRAAPAPRAPSSAWAREPPRPGSAPAWPARARPPWRLRSASPSPWAVAARAPSCGSQRPLRRPRRRRRRRPRRARARRGASAPARRRGPARSARPARRRRPARPNRGRHPPDAGRSRGPRRRPLPARARPPRGRRPSPGCAGAGRRGRRRAPRRPARPLVARRLGRILVEDLSETAELFAWIELFVVVHLRPREGKPRRRAVGSACAARRRPVRRTSL